MLLLATPDGDEGRSTLPDQLPAAYSGARVVRERLLRQRHICVLSVWITLASFSHRAQALVTIMRIPSGTWLYCTLLMCHSQAGTVVFSGQVGYTSFEQFAADEHLHRVPPVGTPYGWQPGKWCHNVVLAMIAACWCSSCLAHSVDVDM